MPVPWLIALGMMCSPLPPGVEWQGLSSLLVDPFQLLDISSSSGYSVSPPDVNALRLKVEINNVGKISDLFHLGPLNYADKFEYQRQQCSPG